MTWMNAIKWAVPVWIVTIGTIGGLMFLTGFAAEVGKAEALNRLVVLTVVALPLIVFLLKATSGDVARFRAAYRSTDDGGSDS